MTYLHQHARTLNFELDFKNPKEHTSERSSRSKEHNSTSQTSSTRKRGKSKDDRGKRSHNARHKSTKTMDVATTSTVPNNQQCRRPTCIQRGTNTNHAHDKCKFKDQPTPTPYPNVGKAPPKRPKRTNHNTTPKRSGAPVVPKPANHNGATPPSSTFTDTRTCYICNQKGHIATHCPQNKPIKVMQK